MVRENRVIRGSWTRGHDRACLLAALSPEAGYAESAAACPAEVMPPWLAYLTPWLDDAPSADAWPHIVRRYASLARRWHVLDGKAWRRAEIASLLAIVEEARTHAGGDPRVLSAIDGVIAWLRRGAPHHESTRVRDAAAAARASAAAAAARASAAWAVDAADAAALAPHPPLAARAAVAGAAAAEAAARASAAWAVDAADAAARAPHPPLAARAAVAGAAAAEAADAAARAPHPPLAARAAVAGAAAAEAAADRIAAGVLDAIEREIERAEAGR
jgi:hypothetical protein